MWGSLVEFAGSSVGVVGSLATDTGSTLVDTLTFLPVHIVEALWMTVFGIAEDLGSTIMPPV
ncbi:MULTISPECIES: hypothetical protein [unclassified Dietzia]|nr:MULTISPECIES: hypothetical protein [unclassified Dietzia]KAB7665408.1 hypothetical protein GBN18_12565 [Plesiomonas shigelloides]AVZ38204.1 hypothetical protein CT688_00585 [Dietzia sp. JS16-p6b]MBB1023721.1 hypothetical protein [Dietzia sp. DQ12-76]MBB1026298.1 hypothetical protein [Dietzia sp. DQ11-38-2]QGW23188.1 hypothetical protein GJR88_00194 [Dietzia sp. DQ12-45-1b]